jgi:hypothetical protein
MSIEISNDLIRNRTRELPACSIVPQPTTLPRTGLRVASLKLTFPENEEATSDVHAVTYLRRYFTESRNENDSPLRGITWLLPDLFNKEKSVTYLFHFDQYMT